MFGWGLLKIGEQEFNKRFCEERLELKSNEKASLWEDRHTRTFPPTDERKWGCCRVPEGEKWISTSENCVYTPEYRFPTISQKTSAFLKRFK